MVAGHVLATILALEVLHAEVQDAVVEILTAEVSVPRSSLNLENTVLDCEKADIESSAYEDVCRR
jgi:hypothetical protein